MLVSSRGRYNARDHGNMTDIRFRHSRFRSSSQDIGVSDAKAANREASGATGGASSGKPFRLGKKSTRRLRFSGRTANLAFCAFRLAAVAALRRLRQTRCFDSADAPSVRERVDNGSAPRLSPSRRESSDAGSSQPESPCRMAALSGSDVKLDQQRSQRSCQAGDRRGVEKATAPRLVSTLRIPPSGRCPIGS